MQADKPLMILVAKHHRTGINDNCRLPTLNKIEYYK
jgi:hypothetical protein